MLLSENLFPLESSIQKYAGSRGAAPVEGAGERSFFHRNFFLNLKKKFLKSSDSYQKFFFVPENKKMLIISLHDFRKKLLTFKKKISLIIFFFVVKCSETYAKKILWSEFFEEAGGLQIVI